MRLSSDRGLLLVRQMAALNKGMLTTVDKMREIHAALVSEYGTKHESMMELLQEQLKQVEEEDMAGNATFPLPHPTQLLAPI